MSVTISGASDDLIEVEGDIREEFNHYGHHEDDAGALLAFSEGTVLRIRYTDGGIWRITPVVRGRGDLTIEQAPEDDDSNYSDMATLTDVRWVVQGSAIAKADRVEVQG